MNCINIDDMNRINIDDMPCMREVKEVIVISYNICMISECYGFTVGDNMQRAERICKVIDCVKPHIICFQELFDHDVQHFFISRLKYRYSYVLDDSPGKFLVGVNSGLAIFTKYKILDSELLTFGLHRGVENFAKKGAMLAKINIHNTVVSVVNTHLQTDDYANSCLCNLLNNTFLTSYQIRMEEVNQIKKFITKSCDGKVLLCGDLNIVNDTVDYNFLLSITKLRDSYDDILSKIKTTNEDGRIDYILTNFPCSSEITDVFRNYSDHNAVVGTFKIEFQ
jgi:endonuclease/exonuclease/phosphatase family metal-dependent hydrolase